MNKLAEVSLFFTNQLTKTAAKDRLGRNKVNKSLEKAKKEYSGHKTNLDQLEAQDGKLRVQLDNTRKLTNDARRRVMTLHKAMQNMDLANASDAVFYNDDSNDIGYIIDSKEYHLETDEAGEMKLVPMRHHRSERKKSLQGDEAVAEDSGCAEDCMEADHGHEPKEEAPVEEKEECGDDYQMSDDELDALYQSLI